MPFYIFCILYVLYILMGFPGGSDGQASACNAGNPGSIPSSIGGSFDSGFDTFLSFFCDSFIGICACVCLHTLSCLTLCDFMDCSPPGSSVEVSRQAYWSGLPFPSPGDPPNPGIDPGLLHLLLWLVGSLLAEPPGEPLRPSYFLTSLKVRDALSLPLCTVVLLEDTDFMEVGMGGWGQ